MPRKKFVFDSIVDVVAPGGRLRNAHTAPSVSANAMTTPPCSSPAVVHRSARHARRPVTSSALAAVSSTPSSPANGISATMSSSSLMATVSQSLAT